MSSLSQEQFNDATPASRVWRRWTVFAATSLALHSLLLLGYVKTQPVLPTKLSGTQVISVSLAPLREQPAEIKAHAAQPVPSEPPVRHPPPVNSFAPEATPTLVSHASPRSTRESTPKTWPEDVAHVPTPGPAPITTREHDTATGQGNLARQTAPATQTPESLAQLEQAQRNFLLGKIRSLLTQHFSYPLRARQRGWEGEVLLGFQVDKNGRLGNVHLARSSGYSLLDEYALAALTQIKNITLFDEHSFPSMELQLPVLYQLREG